MATERENIDLHGGQAKRFREIREALADDLGYQPTKPRVVGHLLEHYDGPHD